MSLPHIEFNTVARVAPTRLRLLVFMLGTIMGLVVALWGWRHQSVVTQANDPYEFGAIGRDLAHGLGFRWRGHITMRRAPLYPALIAVLNLVAPNNPILLLQIIQACLLGGICLLAFTIGARLFSQRAGLIAGLLCAVHPMLLRYVPDVQVEMLLTFLFLLTVWRGVCFRERSTVVNGLAFGAAASFGALVKPTPLLYPLIFLVALWWERRRDSDTTLPPLSLVSVAAVFGAMALIVLPWTARNYRVSGGRFVPVSTNAGGEFLRSFIYMKPQYALLRQRAYVEGEIEANQMEIELFRRQGLEWERDEAETEAVLNAGAKDKLLHAPGATLQKTGVGLFTFWYLLNSKLTSLVVLALTLAAWLFALLGIRRARREPRLYGLALLPILYLNVLYALLLALGRYSSAAIPLLLVLVAYGLESFLPHSDDPSTDKMLPASVTMPQT